MITLEDGLRLATRGLNTVDFSLYEFCILVLGLGSVESTKLLQTHVNPIKCGLL